MRAAVGGNAQLLCALLKVSREWVLCVGGLPGINPVMYPTVYLRDKPSGVINPLDNLVTL